MGCNLSLFEVTCIAAQGCNGCAGLWDATVACAPCYDAVHALPRGLGALHGIACAVQDEVFGRMYVAFS